MIQRVAAGRDLTAAGITDLGGTLSELVARGVTGLYLDTEKALGFDSESLEALLELDAMAKSRGLSFAIVNPSDVLGTALAITGLDDKLTIRLDSDAEASAAASEEIGELP